MGINKLTGQKVKIVYHGSPYLFDKIDLYKGGFLKDFGRGFYLSDTEKHAFSAGMKKVKMLGLSEVYLYTYELPVDWPIGISKHVFREPNKAWLEFIVANRKNKKVKFFDVVYGPTADANTSQIITDYVNGRYHRNGMTEDEVVEEVLKDLKPHKYARQVCIRTENAKSLLNKIDMRVIPI